MRKVGIVKNVYFAGIKINLEEDNISKSII